MVCISVRRSTENRQRPAFWEFERGLNVRFDSVRFGGISVSMVAQRVNDAVDPLVAGVLWVAYAQAQNITWMKRTKRLQRIISSG